MASVQELADEVQHVAGYDKPHPETQAKQEVFDGFVHGGLQIMNA